MYKYSSVLVKVKGRQVPGQDLRNLAALCISQGQGLLSSRPRPKKLGNAVY